MQRKPVTFSTLNSQVSDIISSHLSLNRWTYLCQVVDDWIIRQIIKPNTLLLALKYINHAGAHWKKWQIIKIFRQGLSALHCFFFFFLQIYGKCILQMQINLCHIFANSQTYNFSGSQILEWAEVSLKHLHP